MLAEVVCIASVREKMVWCIIHVGLMDMTSTTQHSSKKSAINGKEVIDMAKKNWRPKRRPQIPTPEQDMFIRKAGFDPYEWLVLWDGSESIKVMHRETRERMVLEK